MGVNPAIHRVRSRKREMEADVWVVEFPLWDLPNRQMRVGDEIERAIHKMRLKCTTPGEYEIFFWDTGLRHRYHMVSGGDPNVAPAASTVATASARKVRDVVEDAVYQTARDILTAPNVAGLESVWRSLRWFTEQCPAAAGIQLEVLDCTSDSAFQAMEGVSVEEDFAEPDLFALVDGPGESAWSEVALFAENRMAPCLMGLPSTLGALEGDALIEYLSAATGSESDERLALRADEGLRWLAIAHNPIVMFQEGAGALQRFVLASPVWGILGALGASYASTGSFARITGQPGQLRVPGMHTLSSGKESGVGIPTLHFTSIRAQTELAALGVIAIGSPRNSDRMALAAVPQYRNSRDALLPAQIWTGRIVRFAKWVQGQLPAGSSSEEAREIFEQAGAVFLYPGTGQAAKITAEISGEGEARMLNIGARMDGSLALIPLQIEFSLPLR